MKRTLEAVSPASFPPNPFQMGPMDMGREETLRKELHPTLRTDMYPPGCTNHIPLPGHMGGRWPVLGTSPARAPLLFSKFPEKTPLSSPLLDIVRYVSSLAVAGGDFKMVDKANGVDTAEPELMESHL